jgi:hypothetical protein
VDYVDALLRKGGLPEPPEESQVEGRLDDLITLYLLRTMPCHVTRCCGQTSFTRDTQWQCHVQN